MNNKLVKRCVFTTIFLCIVNLACAQFTDCTTGLLQMPSAEMQKDGTFMISNLFLNSHTLPNNYMWGREGIDRYNTFSYGISLTFLKRFEIAYVCTLFKAIDNGNWPAYVLGKYTYQDRHFSARVQLIKENEFEMKWIPSIVVGICDPTTGSTNYEYFTPDISGEREVNGHFNRVYVVAS